MRFQAPYPVPELADLPEWQSFKPGLERVRAALKTLGNPHHQFPHVLIGGTNGKGSVASGLANDGPVGTGLFLSPHVEDIRERITVDGAWIADEAWQAAYATLSQKLTGQTFSFFEWLFLISVWLFAQRQVPLAVYEVGLGGRLDATNVLDPLVSAVVSVSLDHTAILGDSIAAIACEKIAIGRPNRPLFVPRSIHRDSYIAKALVNTGARVSVFEDLAGIAESQRLVQGLRLSLQGHGLAMGKVRHRRWQLPARREVLRKVPWLMLDGAHNAAAWQDLASSLTQPVRVLAGLTSGRDPEEFIDSMGLMACEICVSEVGFERELPLSEWPANRIRKVPVAEWPDLLREPLLVCGSLYFAGAFRYWYRNIYKRSLV